MDTREKQLRAESDRIRRELQKIEYERDIAEAKALVGQCFKYPRNSYSCPTSERDYWPVYFKAIRIKNGRLCGIEFQTDKYGEVTINQKSTRSTTMSGYVRISQREFRNALSKLKKNIAAIEATP